MRLFRDKVCLSVDITELSRAQAAARDFRGCTRTMKVGPALYATHGISGARSFSVLGMAELIIDVRMCGRPWEIRAAVQNLLSVPSICGITIQANSGVESMRAALQTASGSVLLTGRVKTPKILATLLPSTISSEELQAEHCLAVTREEYVAKTVCWCHALGVHGVIVDYYDLAVARAACPEMPLLANAKRAIPGRLASLPESIRRLPGVPSVIRAGACHAFFDASLAGRDLDWAADMLGKEMQEAKLLVEDK